MKANFTEVMLTNKHPTIVIGADGLIYDCNDEMVKLLRATQKSELIGINYLAHFVDENDRVAIQENIIDVLDGTPTWGYQNGVFDQSGVRQIKYWSSVKHPYRENTVIAWASDLAEKSSPSKELHKFINAFVHYLSKPIATLLLLESSLQKVCMQNMIIRDLYTEGVNSISEHVELLRVFNQALIEHEIILKLEDVQKVLSVSFSTEQLVGNESIKLQPSLLFLFQRVIQQFREKSIMVTAYVQSRKIYFVFKSLFPNQVRSELSRPLVFHLLRIGLSVTACGEVQQSDCSSTIMISFDII